MLLALGGFLALGGAALGLLPPFARAGLDQPAAKRDFYIFQICYTFRLTNVSRCGWVGGWLVD